VRSLEAQGPDGLEQALETSAQGLVSALLVQGDPRLFTDRARIFEVAARLRLPAMYNRRAWVESDGLMGYGPSFSDLYRRASTYVDKILKGASPADLPIEQPTTFDFAVNLKTAQALGVTIPQSVLRQASETIQ
jgi:putative tryptophan/tyrosine transport system substrate-binding protein